MEKALEQSILQTLAYFSTAQFPLTKEEVYRHLWRSPKTSFNEVSGVLEEMVKTGLLGQQWGFYFLPGEVKSIEARRGAVVYNDIKLAKAKRAVRYIRWVPFLKTVLVCNSVGREVATKESDIDFLIITEPKRIWIVRLFTNTILRLFGMRTYGNKHEDRICLSFYIDTERLNLAPYRAVIEDIHFAYWIQQMIPVHDPDNFYERLLKANVWIDEFVPHRKKTSLLVGETGWFGKVFKRFFEIAWKGAYGDLIEKQAKEMQWMKMRLMIKNNANKPDNAIVITEGILKFHEADTRIAFRESWLSKCATLYDRTS